MTLDHTSNIQPDAPTLPQRKIIRAKFHDYSGGLYFITICTDEKEHFFGKIEDGEMKYSILGKFAYDQLEAIPSHYGYVEVPLFVVMPNHVHAVIAINEPADKIDYPNIRTILGVVVGGYKQAVTRFARRNNIPFDWQPRFHDHIIRGQQDANRIDDYIKNNIARWASDCYYK